MPQLSTMHIVHPLLPWTIRIRASSPASITVYDVFSQLHAKLARSISHAEFWNDLLDSGDRERLATACDLRCRGEVAEIIKGVKRVDFLGPEVVMVGLVRLKEGIWQLKTRTI
ncbi:hypothetical protein BD779DRAFT_226484 [Infundibulicybe gibba]|nr:hypothetical protein BD779DRAFT_226484 [Infundibulicybe gibba]